MSFLLFGLFGAGLLVVAVVQLNKVGTNSQRPELWQLMVSDMTLQAMSRQLSRVSKWTIAAAFCAWGLSSFFLVKYMTGGEMNPASWDLEQWGNAGFALLLTAIITAFQFFLYSINQKGAAGFIGVAVVVFFGLFSEISNSMEREGATVRARSEDSSVFQATVAAISTATGNGSAVGASPALIRAEQAKAKALVEIEACERHKARGQARVDKCLRIERGNLAAAEASINAIEQSQAKATAANQSHALALVDKANTLSFDENQHFEVIKLLKEWLGIAAIFASFLFSFIIMGTFEYAFHYLAIYAANLKKAIKYTEENQTGSATNSGDDLPTKPEPIKSSSVSGGVAGGAVVAEKSDTSKQPEQVPFGFAPSQKPIAKAELPTAQKIGRTGLYNPKLGKSEYHYSLPIVEPLQDAPETVSKPLANGKAPEPEKTVSKPLANGQKGGLYPEWLGAVQAGTCKPSVKPTWCWIQKRVSAKETGSRTHDRTRISAMQKAFFSRAIADGYMIKNPNYKNGMKKFIWNEGA